MSKMLISPECREKWVFAVSRQESRQNGAIQASKGPENTNPDNNRDSMLGSQRSGKTIEIIRTVIRTFCPDKARIRQRQRI